MPRVRKLSGTSIPTADAGREKPTVERTDAGCWNRSSSENGSEAEVFFESALHNGNCGADSPACARATAATIPIPLRFSMPTLLIKTDVGGRTSKMSHDATWRDSWLCRNRDGSRRWLWRLVGLFFSRREREPSDAAGNLGSFLFSQMRASRRNSFFEDHRFTLDN
jgi:hypothetical protein